MRSARHVIRACGNQESIICPNGGMILVVPLPPEPPRGPLWQTLAWSFRPLAFMARNREEIGDAFSVRFLGFERPMVMISDPAAVKALYTERRHGLPPGRTFALEPILGPRSVLLLEGEEHMARRRLMLPPFHGERMRSYEVTVGEIVTAEIDSWQLGREFPIHARMQAVTLEVILRAVFGVAAGPRLDRLRVMLRDVLADTGSVRRQLLGILARRRGRDPLADVRERLVQVDELLFAEIAEHRRRPDLEERHDILSMLMTATFEDGSAMDDKELRDQLMTLLLAGHETTATALAWTFDLLLRHPVEVGRLRTSLEAGEDTYLKATIAEALRLRPVIPIAGRRLVTDLVTEALELPAGTDVTPAIWLTHTNPEIYPEPFAFRPERFHRQAPETYAWIPFGGGVRRCLGAAFAEFEMAIVLREVLTRCDLRKADPRPEKTGRRNITFSPRAGTPVVVEARRPARERAPLAA
ncbi:MAG: cytochrome P450 [Actinobacteria bacterium]|nr:cytochrome P450 [Actinomycetota bacterium]